MLNNNKPYLIGETAFHHEGDTEFLMELINAGISTGINAIKFHLLFDISSYMIEKHEAIDVIKKIAIPENKWDAVLSHVSSTPIEIVLLCNDVESLRWVNQHQQLYNIVAVEIHATGLNDVFLLKEALNFQKTVMLGVGGSTFDEVKYAIDFFQDNNKSDILLMHGFQNYPTRYEDINLKRMIFLRDAFGLPVGYADHTDPEDQYANVISALPQVLGFNILEKHFSHVYGEKRIDAQAAISLDNMLKTKELIEIVASTLGKNNFTFSEAEKKYGNTGPMKKAIVAKHSISAGTILSLDDIAFKRTNNSATMQQKDLDKLIGNEVLRDIDKDELIDTSCIDYQFKALDFNSQFFIEKK